MKLSDMEKDIALKKELLHSNLLQIQQDFDKTIFENKILAYGALAAPLLVNLVFFRKVLRKGSVKPAVFFKYMQYMLTANKFSSLFGSKSNKVHSE